MPSPDIQLADEITSRLDAAAFSLAFTPERMYAADWDLKSELGILQCGVWPGEAEGNQFERTSLLWDFTVSVALAQRLVNKTRAEVDGFMDLAWEVVKNLELVELPIGGKVYVNQAVRIPLRFDPNNLQRNKRADDSIVYTGVFATHLQFDFTELV